MFQALLVLLTGGTVHSKHYLIETGQNNHNKFRIFKNELLQLFYINCKYLKNDHFVMKTTTKK